MHDKLCLRAGKHTLDALAGFLCEHPRLTCAPHALLATRQAANSLSVANKLLIRCAWAGTPAFVDDGWPSGGYGSKWAYLGSCP